MRDLDQFCFEQQMGGFQSTVDAAAAKTALATALTDLDAIMALLE